MNGTSMALASGSLHSRDDMSEVPEVAFEGELDQFPEKKRNIKIPAP